MVTNFKELDAKYYMPAFSRNMMIVRGKGSHVWDSAGIKYLDLVAGIAVCSTGHCHPEVSAAIARQAQILIHCSNLYYVPGQSEFAEKLSHAAGLGKVFFTNSGAESNDAALKLARVTTGRKNFVSFEHDFHGRTIGSLACTHKPEIREPFEPLGIPCEFAPYGDLEKVKELVTKDTAGVIFEPVQGETGIIVPPKDFLPGIRDICDDAGALMICDEVQSGMGRTGKWFAYQHTKIKPDIISMAKGIASGFPMGAIIAAEGIEFTKGQHGSTFAGGPLACAAGNATFDVLEKILPDVAKKGERFKANLLPEIHPRVFGLMIGFTAGEKAQAIADYCKENNVLVNVAGGTNIRLVPPLIIENRDIDTAVKVINEAVSSISIQT